MTGQTESGHPFAPVYGPEPLARRDPRAGPGAPASPACGPGSVAGGAPGERLGAPGAYPYPRGIYPTMYTGRPWTMRQYAGFGTATEANRRYHQLIAARPTGLARAR